jgi:hydrogenase expression/formation protein HypC
MCLGIPGKIVKKWQDKKTHTQMAKVDFGGVQKEVCIMFTPKVKVGEYVVVHVGFAINKIDEAAAKKSLRLLKEVGSLEAELEG